MARDIPLIVVPFKNLETITEGIRGDNKFLEKISKMAPYSFSSIQELQSSGNFQCGVSSAALFQFGCYMPEFYQS